MRFRLVGTGLSTCALALASVVVMGCHEEPAGAPRSAERAPDATMAATVDARARVQAIGARAVDVEGFRRDGDWLVPTVAPGALVGVAERGRVRLPQRAAEPFEVSHERSGLAVRVALVGARASEAEIADGLVLYRGAHADGADVVHRVTADGTEDYVVFERAPAESRVDYAIELGDEVRGLRLVARTLELLDAAGTPWLRVAPPWLVDDAGRRHDAALSVDGCAVDTSPAAPWGRPVTDPGARTCVVRVAWDGAAVRYPAVLDPSWVTTGAMSTIRVGHSATVLADGRVLVAGGMAENQGPPLATAELYDLATGTWAATGALNLRRTEHTAVTLADGIVLAAGGAPDAGTSGAGTTSAELYDPDSGMWTATDAMDQGRTEHTATRLADGRVLVVAGSADGTNPALTSAELYDPAAGTWATTDALTQGRRAHTATLLADDRVLVAAGLAGATTRLASAEIFDPATDTWADTDGLTSGRFAHSASLLADGRVLAAGGSTAANNFSATAELYDPVDAVWSNTGALPGTRGRHSGTTLPDGRVLVAGGFDADFNTLATTALYDPADGTWAAGPSMDRARLDHTASLLAGGVVLIAGGSVQASGEDLDPARLRSAELFGDGILGADCTTADQCDSGFCVDGVCCEDACGAGEADCLACSVAAGGSSDGRCGIAAAGTSCRDAAEPICDLVEECDGASDACPGDAFAPDGTACVPGASCEQGACMPDEGGGPDAGDGGGGGGADDGDGGGCGCRGAGATGGAALGWLVPLAMVVVGLRRRRRQSR